MSVCIGSSQIDHVVKLDSSNVWRPTQPCGQFNVSTLSVKLGVRIDIGRHKTKENATQRARTHTHSLIESET